MYIYIYNIVFKLYVDHLYQLLSWLNYIDMHACVYGCMYVCTVCMYSMYVQHVCTVCMYVCTM